MFVEHEIGNSTLPADDPVCSLLLKN